MLACPLVKLAHLVCRLAVRLDLHRGFPLGRRVTERGAIRNTVRAGVQPIILHELRRFLIHARRGRASRREDHESGLAAHLHKAGGRLDRDQVERARPTWDQQDRKSTRPELQSLMRISYAVFCLKKKKNNKIMKKILKI